MAEIHERDTVVVKDRDGSSGAWVFGVVVAALAALGIWYFMSSQPTTTVPVNEPAATSTMDPAAPTTTAPATITPDASAPAAPAPTDTPAIDAAPAAPAAPAPAN